VLSLDNIQYHPTIRSVGTDEGGNAVLWYPPKGAALDKIPTEAYDVIHVYAQYLVLPDATDDFLAQILQKLRYESPYNFGANFGINLQYEGVTWQGTNGSWPSDPQNAAWIKFWRDLDIEIGDKLETVKLGETFWQSLGNGPLGPNLLISNETYTSAAELLPLDQLGNLRPANQLGDIGSIELQDIGIK